MANIIQKLMAPFKPMAPEGLSKTAKDCREAADRYRACAERLCTASKCFEAGNFEAGYDQLKNAEKDLDKK